MGTNYYVRTNSCAACCRHDVVHIGKQSMGWAFCFSPQLPTFAAWKALLEQNSDAIYDEYDRRIPLAEFLADVEAEKGKAWEMTKPDQYPSSKYETGLPPYYEYLDPDGYRFSKNAGFS